MIIDFHTHCFADSVAKNAVSALEKECGVKPVHDGTVAGLKAHMAACGVDKAVVQPVATKPSQVASINAWARETSDKHLVFFGALHPDDPDIYQTITQLKQDGLKGVKLHPDYQRFLADEPRMMPIYEALRDTGLIVLVHAGVDIGLYNLVHCTPLMIKNVINNVPGLHLVAAHMGGHALWHDVEDLLFGKDVYLDTSYSYYMLKSRGMTRMIQKHGADKVLFGTDSPWKRADTAVQQIRALDLPADDIERILCQNAYELLQ